MAAVIVILVVVVMVLAILLARKEEDKVERKEEQVQPILSNVLIDFSLTVKATTLIFISGRGSAISSAKEGKSGFIYNLVKSYKL